MRISAKFSNVDYYTFIFCIVVFLLPYSIAITNLFLIAMAIWWLKDMATRKHAGVFKANFKYILPFILLFLAYLISVSYSSDLREALKTIERRIPVLLLPLIIFSTPFKRKHIEVVFYAFILSVAICCVTALLLTVYYFFQNPSEYYLEKALWYMPQTIGFHAPYLALYLVISNIICYYFYLHEKTRGLVLFIFILNNIFLFLISSRVALAINWMFIACLSTYYLSRSRGFIVATLNIFLIVGICYLAFVNIPYLHTKISKLTEAAYGLNHRVLAAEAAFEVIRNNLLLGVGIGDIQSELNKALPDATYADINVHNQYLHEIMTYGFVGFAIFVSVFVLGFWKAIKHKDGFFSLFLISFLFVFLTEVILSRYQGIMLFSVFFPLFLSLHNSSPPVEMKA